MPLPISVNVWVLSPKENIERREKWGGKKETTGRTVGRMK